ncbi:MAG: DEAD/DEAH box helicase family protein, partial [Marinagarivorans sp.]|nr:DEAD/DEAH box helicase family protein [Marinagarivorans sp.]
AYCSILGIANTLTLNPEKLLANIHAVQAQNVIEKSASLYAPGDAYPFSNFSIEMETGTGKTYVYLRTIFDLHQQKGLRKFIIVVPSVAIREGVLSSLRLMKEHFKGLYGNTPSIIMYITLKISPRCVSSPPPQYVCKY